MCLAQPNARLYHFTGAHVEKGLFKSFTWCQLVGSGVLSFSASGAAVLKDKNIRWSEGSSLSLIINTFIIKAVPPRKRSMARSKRDSVRLVSSGVTMDTGFTLQNYSHCMPLEVQLIKPKCQFILVIEQNDSLCKDNTSTGSLPFPRRIWKEKG